MSMPDYTDDEITDRLTGRYAVAVEDRTVRLPDIDALLELINDGSYDSHIEAILAAGHARKRARRGVRRPYGITEGR